MVAKYRFVIKDIAGITRFISITRCKKASTAQVLGTSHLKINDYPKGYYVDVV